MHRLHGVSLSQCHGVPDLLVHLPTPPKPSVYLFTFTSPTEDFFLSLPLHVRKCIPLTSMSQTQLCYIPFALLILVLPLKNWRLPSGSTVNEIGRGGKAAFAHKG